MRDSFLKIAQYIGLALLGILGVGMILCFLILVLSGIRSTWAACFPVEEKKVVMNQPSMATATAIAAATSTVIVNIPPPPQKVVKWRTVYKDRLVVEVKTPVLPPVVKAGTPAEKKEERVFVSLPEVVKETPQEQKKIVYVFNKKHNNVKISSKGDKVAAVYLVKSKNIQPFFYEGFDGIFLSSGNITEDFSGGSWVWVFDDSGPPVRTKDLSVLPFLRK